MLAASVLFTACAAQPEPQPQPAEAQPVPMSEREINTYLDAALVAIQADQLTFPDQGSALSLYNKILARNPGQKEALRGLEHIVELHIERALAALERRQLATARSMVARARLVLPDHPSIEPTSEQIRLISEANRLVVNLPTTTVQAQEQILADALNPVADLPPQQSCRFNIWASSDREARKIYRALSDRATTLAGFPMERLRAQISIRSTAAVERLCFENR